ncbi:hypothetical protein FB446DRAFT_616707, partial [Lentinula raphanica]
TSEVPHPEQCGQRISMEFLNALPHRECLYWFRFYAEEIEELARLLRIPDPFITKTRSRFSAIEALALLLARFQSPGDIYSLVLRYDHSQSAISEVVNELTVYLNDTWHHLLEPCNSNPNITTEHMTVFAAALKNHGAPLDFIWAFVDCTIRGMCRPTYHQHQAYNGYKHVHALKYQA